MFRFWQAIRCVGDSLGVENGIEDGEHNCAREETDQYTDESEANFLLVEVIDADKDIAVGAKEGEHHCECEGRVDAKGGN